MFGVHPVVDGARDEEGVMAMYRIRVKGLIGAHWQTWFEGLAIEPDEVRGETALTGRLVDQAALHGVLARIRDLGLPLLAVAEVSAPGNRPTDEHLDV